MHLLQQRLRRRPFAQRQQGHLRPLPRHVARADDAQQRDVGHQADPHGAGRGQVAAERPGEQHLGDVGVGQALFLQQQHPAGRDRRLGELQLADVALGEVEPARRVVGVAGGLVAQEGEHEHPLLADLPQPRGQPGRHLRGVGRDQPARGVDEPGGDHGRDGVDETGAGQPDRGDVADDLQQHVLVADLHALDRARGGPHPAADGRALERRPGGRGRREQAVARGEQDLAVRADVDEQPDPPVAVHPRRERARDDVAADVGAQRREHVRPGPRVHGDAEVGGTEVVERPGRHDERARRPAARGPGPARGGPSWRCPPARSRRPRAGRPRRRRTPRPRAGRGPRGPAR